MMDFLQAHLFWVGVIGFWVFSAAVSNMPEPNGNLWYRWLYGFLHTIAGNITVAFGSKIPGMTAKKD